MLKITPRFKGISLSLEEFEVDKAIEEIGFDVAELGNVSEEFLEAVREDIKLKGDKKYLYSLPENHVEVEDEKDGKTDEYEIEEE